MNYSIIVYGIFMALTAFICRKLSYEKQIFIYTISMVAFSSAIANQYLAIPMAAIIVLETGVLKYIYMFMTFVFLVLHSDGLGVLSRIEDNGLPEPIMFACEKYTKYAYVLLAWVLFITLLYYLFGKEKIQKSFIKQKE